MTDQAFQLDAFQSTAFQILGSNAFQSDAFDDGAFQDFITPPVIPPSRSNRARIAFLAHKAPFGMLVARARKS